jgi:predicted transcriptional regulator
VARPRLPRPTDAELQILAVLWESGGATVREIYNVLSPIRGSGYNSVLKLVQIMHDKKYVKRDDSRRPQVYTAAVGEQQTKRLLLKDLLDRVFAGSAEEMVTHIQSLKKGSPREKASSKGGSERVARSRG